LSGVDTEGILANAQAVDNPGNQRRKVRELLFEQLGIADRDELFLEHEILWRGTERHFQVIFGNVRELPTESLATKGGSRKVVIDFPFDELGHSPTEDETRLNDFRADGKPARTLVWLPTFLSMSARRDHGTLVKLDDILKSDDTFRRYR
ncbi:MAG: phage resistance protein, partial [Chromatiaceae bacterium]